MLLGKSDRLIKITLKRELRKPRGVEIFGRNSRCWSYPVTDATLSRCLIETSTTLMIFFV